MEEWMDGGEEEQTSLVVYDGAVAGGGLFASPFLAGVRVIKDLPDCPLNSGNFTSLPY